MPSDTVIVKAIHTCYGIPSTWDAWTATGQYRHFKYRHGQAKVFIGPEDGPFELESAVTYGDQLNGITTLEEFCQATGFTLALREPYRQLPDPNGGVWSRCDDEEPDIEEDIPVRAQVLREAESLVCGDREDQYGNPRDNLKRIAEYWNDYLYPIMQSGDLLQPRDVALMMILAKIAREAAGHKRDSCVDIAGYAAIAAEVA